MTPATSFSPMSSPDDAPARATDVRSAGRAPMEPVPDRLLPHGLFELRCADVHPFGCEEVLSATSPSDLVARACAHGARVHGFTPVFYSRERLAAITAAAAGVS